MLLIVSKYLIPNGFRGMTIFPFVILRDRAGVNIPVLMNHEKIHLRQQLELLILPFFIWYVLEYVIRLVQFGNRHLAYRNISFEREAYQNESDLKYLQSRPFWAFVKLI